MAKILGPTYYFNIARHNHPIGLVIADESEKLTKEEETKLIEWLAENFDEDVKVHTMMHYLSIRFYHLKDGMFFKLVWG